jgi:hypothetical protein
MEHRLSLFSTLLLLTSCLTSPSFPSPRALHPPPSPLPLPPHRLCPPIAFYTMPMTCAGLLKDNTACTCRLFIARRSKETKCKTCGHRQALHSDIPATSHSANPPMTTEAPENKYVNRLAKSLEASSVHESARKEMLQGFRPRPQPVKVSTPIALRYFH